MTGSASKEGASGGANDTAEKELKGYRRVMRRWRKKGEEGKDAWAGLACCQSIGVTLGENWLEAVDKGSNCIRGPSEAFNDGWGKNPLEFWWLVIFEVIQLIKFANSLKVFGLGFRCLIPAMAISVSQVPEVEPLFEDGGYYISGPGLAILLLCGLVSKICLLSDLPINAELAFQDLGPANVCLICCQILIAGGNLDSVVWVPMGKEDRMQSLSHEI